MKILILILISCSVLLSGCTNGDQPRENTGDYNTQNLSINNQTQESEVKENESKAPKEEELSRFSTKISQKDPDRQNNITIACNALNGIIVKAGETFSFCNTLGPAAPEDGYEKADTFDADGDKIQAYGGGKCQISTTLYNAVLAVPTLTVVERHAHSGPVYYVEEGKDACVSYGSCDFQFTNNNDFDIKMYVSNTPDSIDIRLVKISS